MNYVNERAQIPADISPKVVVGIYLFVHNSICARMTCVPLTVVVKLEQAEPEQVRDFSHSIETESHWKHCTVASVVVTAARRTTAKKTN